jgi:hypothetical protein
MNYFTQALLKSIPARYRRCSHSRDLPEVGTVIPALSTHA